MRIVLGSKSDDKRRVSEEALSELHLDVSIAGVDVESEIDKQPLSQEVTKKGSENRAKNARKLNPDADLWIGLEGGLQELEGFFHLVTFASIVDGAGGFFVGEGSEIALPLEVSKAVKDGEWFGDVIREYAKENDIDENLVSRRGPFKEAIQNAYASSIRQKLDYRKKASAVVLNDDNKILAVQLVIYTEFQWNVPGGGIEEGESPMDAMERELREELGTDKFEFVEPSGVKNRYEFPDSLLVEDIKNGKSRYRGQEQNQFIFRFKGEDSDIHLQKEEVRRYQWIDYGEMDDYLLFHGQSENIRKVIAASEKVKELFQR